MPPPVETGAGPLLRALIDRHTGGVVPRRTLDVGAGDGWFMAELPRVGAFGTEIVCWDVNYSWTSSTPTSARASSERPTGPTVCSTWCSSST